MNQLGKIIKEARLAKGMTQAELGKTLGLGSAQFVYMMERSVSKVPLPLAKKLCKTLDLNKNEIAQIYKNEFSQLVDKELGVKS